MHCKNCENLVPETARYCPHCGISLGAPDMSMSLVALAKALNFESQGKVARAINEMERVVMEHPSGETFMYYGQILMFNGELNKALDAFQQSIQLNPLNTRAFFQTGLAWMRIGKIDKAIEYFRKALSIDENFHLARYWLGLTYLHISDYHNAKPVFEVLLRKSPDYNIVRYHLGRIAIDLGDYNGALNYFTELAGKVDCDAQICFYIGVAYYRQGEYVRAKENFAKTLEMNPDHPKAKTYLEDCLYELKTLL